MDKQAAGEILAGAGMKKQAGLTHTVTPIHGLSGCKNLAIMFR